MTFATLHVSMSRACLALDPGPTITMGAAGFAAHWRCVKGAPPDTRGGVGQVLAPFGSVPPKLLPVLFAPLGHDSKLEERCSQKGKSKICRNKALVILWSTIYVSWVHALAMSESRGDYKDLCWRSGIRDPGQKQGDRGCNRQRFGTDVCAVIWRRR